MTNPTSTPSPLPATMTPRTDKAAFYADEAVNRTTECVHVTFTRQLERELTAASHQVAELTKEREWLNFLVNSLRLPLEINPVISNHDREEILNAFTYALDKRASALTQSQARCRELVGEGAGLKAVLLLWVKKFAPQNVPGAWDYDKEAVELIESTASIIGLEHPWRIKQ